LDIFEISELIHKVGYGLVCCSYINRS